MTQKAYLLIARIDDYYTSATPIGIFSTFEKAMDEMEKLYKNISPIEYKEPFSFIDRNLFDYEKLSGFKLFDGKYIYGEYAHEVTIGIIEYEIK